MSDGLDDYQRRAKRKLRNYKERMARRDDMGEIEDRVGNLERLLEELEAKWEGLTQGVEGMCTTMDNLINKLASMTGAKGELGKEIAGAMQKDMDEFYNNKMHEIFDVIVALDESRILCDLCGKDWTDIDTSGGIMFAGKSICPECEPGIEEKALQETEEHLITARCPNNMSHAEWIVKIIRPMSKAVGGLKGVDIRPLSEWMKLNKDKGKEDE